MNEALRITLQQDNRPVVITGFDAKTCLLFAIGPDPYPHQWAITLVARDPGTKIEQRAFQRRKGWDPSTYRYAPTIENGSLEADGFPYGNYEVSLDISGFPNIERRCPVMIPKNGMASLVMRVAVDRRTIKLALNRLDKDMSDLISGATIEGMDGRTWLQHPAPNAGRKACLLNILARLRSIPAWDTGARNLLNYVQQIFYVRDERIYAKVDPAFSETLASYVDEKQHFYGDSMLDRTHRALFDLQQLGQPAWQNFRQAGSPSLQAVIALPPEAGDGVPPATRQYFADIDIDFTNPLQDVASFGAHLQEIVQGSTTDQFVLWHRLSADPATAPYLGYSVPDNATATNT